MNKKVLIIVDMQKGFITNNNYKNLTTKINNYLTTNNYDKIILTKFKNEDNSLYETKLNWFELKSKESQDFSIKVPDNSVIFEKTGYGLTDKHLKEIADLNVKAIDVCGLQTDACVYAIALQLFDMGIFPNVLANYIATNPDREDVAKNILIHQFGNIDNRV